MPIGAPMAPRGATAIGGATPVDGSTPMIGVTPTGESGETTPVDEVTPTGRTVPTVWTIWTRGMTPAGGTAQTRERDHETGASDAKREAGKAKATSTAPDLDAKKAAYEAAIDARKVAEAEEKQMWDRFAGFWARVQETSATTGEAATPEQAQKLTELEKAYTAAKLRNQAAAEVANRMKAVYVAAMKPGSPFAVGFDSSTGAASEMPVARTENKAAVVEPGSISATADDDGESARAVAAARGRSADASGKDGASNTRQSAPIADAWSAASTLGAETERESASSDLDTVLTDPDLGQDAHDGSRTGATQGRLGTDHAGVVMSPEPQTLNGADARDDEGPRREANSMSTAWSAGATSTW